MKSTARRIREQELLSEIVAKNVGYFYEKQWTQRESKGKTVYTATKGTVSPQLNTLEMVAARAKIPAWYLLLPLEEDLMTGKQLAELVYTFIELKSKDRQWIIDTMARLK